MVREIDYRGFCLRDCEGGEWRIWTTGESDPLVRARFGTRTPPGGFLGVFAFADEAAARAWIDGLIGRADAVRSPADADAEIAERESARWADGYLSAASVHAAALIDAGRTDAAMILAKTLADGAGFWDARAKAAARIRAEIAKRANDDPAVYETAFGG